MESTTKNSSKINMISTPRLLPDCVLATGRNIPAVFAAAWKSVTRSRLPRVWLYTQVYRTAFGSISTRNRGNEDVLPGARNLGKCHNHQTTARIRLAVSGLCLDCSL